MFGQKDMRRAVSTRAAQKATTSAKSLEEVRMALSCSWLLDMKIRVSNPSQ